VFVEGVAVDAGGDDGVDDTEGLGLAGVGETPGVVTCAQAAAAPSPSTTREVLKISFLMVKR
jgi:hypothetical protein